LVNLLIARGGVLAREADLLLPLLPMGPSGGSVDIVTWGGSWRLLQGNPNNHSHGPPYTGTRIRTGDVFDLV
jgi:hypothetical protein